MNILVIYFRFCSQHWTLKNARSDTKKLLCQHWLASLQLLECVPYFLGWLLSTSTSPSLLLLALLSKGFCCFCYGCCWCCFFCYFSCFSLCCVFVRNFVTFILHVTPVVVAVRTSNESFRHSVSL